MPRVMSCNIRFSNPQDGAHDWVHRKDFVAELIHSESAGIIGTQEGREPQLRELEELLPNHTLIDQHRSWIQERMYPCLFIDLSLYEVLGSGDIWLSETPEVAGSSSFESAFPRLCTYAKLKDLKTEQEFFVVDCHLDHVKEETRVEQIKVLLAEIHKVSGGSPLILMGDFNTSPTGPVREIVNQTKLVDPWLTFGHEEETSFHKFDGKDPDGSKTRIDWILHTPDFKAESIKLIKENKEGLYPSDHFFVCAILEPSF